MKKIILFAVVCISLFSCTEDKMPNGMTFGTPSSKPSDGDSGTPYKVPTEAGFFNLSNSSGWSGKWYSFAKEGEDGYLNFDASAYDYAWIKFSGNTCRFRFGITYSEWKSTEEWGETYYESMNIIEDVKGISYIKLEKNNIYKYDGENNIPKENPYKGDTWDKHIKQIFIQDDYEPTSVIVEGVWFGKEAELKAAIKNAGGDDTLL